MPTLRRRVPQDGGLSCQNLDRRTRAAIRPTEAVAFVSHLGVYAGLSLASLLAATILPVQSEVVLFGLPLTEHYRP